MSESHPEPTNANTSAGATLILGHSSDADDAFMWWPIGAAAAVPEKLGVERFTPAGGEGGGGFDRPAIDTGRWRFSAIAADIEELNRRAIDIGDLDITAISMHALSHASGRYALLATGCSFGDGYGPKIVAREPMPIERLRDPGVCVAVPGEKTTAFLVLRLMLGSSFRYRVMPFDHVISAVRDGVCEAGIVIHEGQLTFQRAGLTLIEDEGAWWKRETGLPLPLGANVIRTDLDERFGEGSLREVAGLLRASIEHSLTERARGLDASRRFAEKMAWDIMDEFVGMYVNELTIDCGQGGYDAVVELLQRGHAAGLCPDASGLRFVR